MPRFYRHIRQGGRLIEDPEGIERPDLGAARAEALDGTRDLLAEAIRHGRDDWLTDAIVITDEAGQELLTIPFIEALPPRLYEALLAVLPSVTRSPSEP
ncbi:DUF6894 family protein [Microvirga makkahensis]|uniref:DUF6894 family protein n=1 Tax=Microvirga makkahensis TaxID=1128670 RepID=UPI00197BCDB4|nr:hypothetical protein [Microvirga makkahensis]